MAQTVAMIEVEAWERQPDETAKAFQAFAMYRDLGPGKRSLAEVGRQLGKSKALMDRWSVRHQWVNRVTEFDAEQDRKKLLEVEELRKEMAERHARIGQQMLNAVAKRLVGTEDGKVDPIDPNILTPTELARITEVASRLERLARGEPTENVAAALTGNGSLDDMRRMAQAAMEDPETRELARQLLVAIAARGSAAHDVAGGTRADDQPE